MHKGNLIFWSLFINLIFFLGGILLFSQIPVASIRDWIRYFGTLGILAYGFVYFLLLIIPFNPIPKNVITYFGLVSFGPLIALITTLIVDLLGVLFNYFIAFWFHRFFSKKFKKSLRQFQDISFWALLTTRILPITEGFAGADFPSYAAGVIKMPIAGFLIATFIPWIIIDSVYFFGLEHFLSNKFLIPIFIVIVGFSLVQIIFKLRKK